MEESKTIERSQVTDLSVQELLELGAIDESEVEEYKERITVSESRPQTTPTERSFNETTKQGVKSVLSGAKDYVTDNVVPFFRRVVHSQTKKTIYGEVDKVNSTEYGIELIVKHPDEKDRRLTFSQDSKRYANLLSYYNTTNPLDLKGEKLIKKPNNDTDNDTDNDICTYYLPSNVSLSGRLRYKMFGYLNNIRNVLKKTPDVSDLKAIVFLAFVSIAFLTVTSVTYSMMEPVLEESVSDRTSLYITFGPTLIPIVPLMVFLCKGMLLGLLQIPLQLLHTEEYEGG